MLFQTCDSKVRTGAAQGEQNLIGYIPHNGIKTGAALGRLIFLFGLAALLILLAGCGGGGSAEAVTHAPVTEPATTQVIVTETVTMTEAPVPVHVEEIVDVKVDTELFNISNEAVSNLPPVATVAGFGISQSEYRYMLNSFKSLTLLNTGIREDSEEYKYFWDRTAANGKTRLDEARERVLTELHQLKICEVIAKDRGIALEQYEIENISTDLWAQESRFGGRENFEKVLMDDYGITIYDYWNISESVTLRDKLLNDVMEAITIPENEVRGYYDQNIAMYGDDVRLRVILLLMEGADPSNERTPEDTATLANSTLEELRAGADMEMLAIERSEDASVMFDGGERVVGRDDPFLPEAVLEWAFAGGIGGYEIFETSFGYYIVHFEERLSRSFEDVKTDIDIILREQRLASQIADWLKDPAFALKIDREVLNGII